MLDEMIEEITIDTYGDDEKFWAFRQAFEDNVELPADGFVIQRTSRSLKLRPTQPRDRPNRLPEGGQSASKSRGSGAGSRSIRRPTSGC
ncbi:MAG: hypothetical protein WBV21_10725 [Desulfobacterales bacterium]